MKKKIKILLIIICAGIIAYSAFYLTDYKHADETAKSYLNGTENVSVTEVSNGLFLNGSGNDTALIFYPGAKYEYISYLPMFMELSGQGVDAYIVEMPFNIAFFNEDGASEIIDNTNYTHYFIAGHSLGGFVASSYVNHTGKVDGLILLAAYPQDEINKPVLSIYGSQDKVMNIKTYNDSKHLMDNLTEVVIDGANHGQFAYCGNQSGDGIAKITPENQQNQTVNEILNFTDSVLNAKNVKISVK